jgi:hypothetical protein
MRSKTTWIAMIAMAGMLLGCVRERRNVLPQASVVSDDRMAVTADKEKAMPSEKDDLSMYAPTKTPQQVSDLLIAFIDSIAGADDLLPSQIEQATGLRVNVHPQRPNRFGFHGMVDADWNYGVRSLPDSDNDSARTLMFYFNNPANNSADMTPICDPDFETYKARLIAIGFQPEPAYGEHGRLLYWDFRRGMVSVQVHVRGESREKAGHHCVPMMLISS